MHLRKTISLSVLFIIIITIGFCTHTPTHTHTPPLTWYRKLSFHEIAGVIFNDVSSRQHDGAAVSAAASQQGCGFDSRHLRPVCVEFTRSHCVCVDFLVTNSHLR